MKKRLKKIYNFILDLIFPIYCLGCQKEGFWLCQNCFNKIKINDELQCPVCKNKSPQGKVCKKCENLTFLSGLWIAADYNEEIIKNSIHILKYKFAFDITRSIAQILVRFINNNKFILKNDFIIVPVPLHKKRFLLRGFNQSELLAKEISKTFSLKLSSQNLIRIKYTQAQVELDKKDRENNIKNAFFIKKPLEFSGKSVILIDDVYTTGSTMNECAKVLKQAGVKEVWGLVIARG